jgi:hypothetical protein
MKTILDVVKKVLVQLAQFLKIVLRHLGLNNYLSLSTMMEADFTEIEEICGSEFQNLGLAETNFYEYYTQNVVVTLRPAHKRLLNGIKASLKENGPTYYSAKLVLAPRKTIPNSCPSNRAAVGIKKPAKSKGIAQQSSKLFEILENLAQRPGYQRFKTKHATSEEISFLVQEDEEKFKAQVECPLLDCKKTYSSICENVIRSKVVRPTTG